MDNAFRDAMLEHVAELEEELNEYRDFIKENPKPKTMTYRAIERTMQLLIEACIGIAKQAIKAKGKQVPSDARQAFNKLAALGMPTGSKL